ncbi:MAG: MerR family transcriptional regulator [candidate division FCPU426 bacterium]
MLPKDKSGNKQTWTTLDIARRVNCHPNTVRLYEAWGYLQPVSRAQNGYRRYTGKHLRQMILARTALPGPYPGGGAGVQRLVRLAARRRYQQALQLARQYQATVRRETKKARAVLGDLEQWARMSRRLSGHPIIFSRIQAARISDVTVDSLRHWERNNLLAIKRNHLGYREYSRRDLSRITIVKALSQAGYSLAAILNMFNQYDRGTIRHVSKKSLAAILNTPAPDAPIVYVTDRWLTLLEEHKQRALKIIQLLAAMERMAASSK